VERAMIMGSTEQLQANELLFAAVDADSGGPAAGGDDAGDALNLDKVEQLTIEKALRKHSGNISHAAKELGITRTSLYRRMEKYGL
jgi:transcriptional regulator with PAS, ATPase and Fis domain